MTMSETSSVPLAGQRDRPGISAASGPTPEALPDGRGWKWLTPRALLPVSAGMVPRSPSATAPDVPEAEASETEEEDDDGGRFRDGGGQGDEAAVRVVDGEGRAAGADHRGAAGERPRQ